MLTAEEIGHEVLKFIVAVGEAKGVNARISILREADLDPEIGEWLFAFLKMVKDPSHNYYLTAKHIPEPQAQGSGPGPFASNFSGLLLLLTSLSARTHTGHAAEKAIAHWLFHADATHRWLFKMAIERSLPGNIGRTLINKVRPGLIYKQPYGGCKPWDPDMVNKRFSWLDGVVWQTKEDGMTLLVDVFHQTVRTRSGQDVSQQMKKHLHGVFMTFPMGYICHFEAKMLDDNYEPMDRPAANGVFNAIFKTNRKVDTEKMQLVLLDIIPRREFYGEDRPNMTCIKRLDVLADAINSYQTAKHDEVRDWPDVQAIYWVWAHTLAECRRMAQQEISFGGEGAILKRPDGVWKSGKMTSQMKMKNEFECTLLVVGYKPHSKNAGWVGSLRCVSADNEIDTYVGSGLNEVAGHDLNRTFGYESFHGMLVEVKAEKISKHNALDLPRLIEIRKDKTSADTGQEVRDAYADSQSVNNC